MKTAITTFVALLVLLSSSFATARTATDLVNRVPGQSPLIVGVEMAKIRATPMFKEGMAFIQKVAAPNSVLHFALSKKAFDVERDIDNAVIAMKSAPLSPQAPPPPTMAVIDGRFDQKKVIAAIEETFGKLSTRKLKGLTVYSATGVDFAFVDANTFVIAEKGFAEPTWNVVSNPSTAASANKALMSLIDLTDTTKGIWFTVNTKNVALPKQTPDGQPIETPPDTDGGGIAVDLRQGLALDFRTRYANAEDATKAKAQFEEIKAASGDNKLVATFGAEPLVKNLTAAQTGTVLTIQTRMTPAETRTMIQRLKAMNEKPPPVAPSTATTDGKTQPQPTGQGAKADFN